MNVTKPLFMALLGFLLVLAVLPTNSVSQKNIANEIEVKIIEVIELPAKKTRKINASDLRCMAENIYYEAGNQSYAGKMAVGLVVLNRVSNPVFPKTVCDVIHQNNDEICQFSWTCEANRNIIDEQTWSWITSLRVAKLLLTHERGSIADITEGSLYFHNTSVKPDWSRIKRKTVKIDDHIFYK